METAATERNGIHHDNPQPEGNGQLSGKENDRGTRSGVKPGSGNQPARPYVKKKPQPYVAGAGQAALELNTKSTMLNKHINSANHKKANTAFMRVGTLLVMTANDHVNQKKISDWLDHLFKQMADNINTDEESIKVLWTGNAPKLDIISAAGDTKHYFYINHPRLRQFINQFNRIDGLAYEVDQLWFAGLVTDERREMSYKKLMYPMNSITEHFNYVTNISRRSGGTYAPEEFLKLLSEQESMRAFIMHHFKGPEHVKYASTVKKFAGCE